MLELLLIAQLYSLPADQCHILADPDPAPRVMQWKDGNVLELHCGDSSRIIWADVQKAPDVVEFIMSERDREAKLHEALDALYGAPAVFNDEYWNGLEKIYKFVQAPASDIDAYRAFGLSVTGKPVGDLKAVEQPYYIYGDLPSDLGDSQPTFRALDTADIPTTINTPNPPPFMSTFEVYSDTFKSPVDHIDIIKRVQQLHQWQPLAPQSSESIKPTWFERQQAKHPVIVAKACAFRNSCQWMAPISSFAMSVLLPIGLALLK